MRAEFRAVGIALAALYGCASERATEGTAHRPTPAHTASVPGDVAPAFAGDAPPPSRGIESAPAGGVDLGVERALLDEADAALKRSDYATAREQSAAAIDALLARAVAERDADWLGLVERAGRSAWAAQDARASSRAWSVLLDVRKGMLPDDHPDVQAARYGLATTIYSLGDVRGARALFEQVLEVRSRSLSDEDPDLQKARHGLAITLHALGDYGRARALQEKVLEVRSRMLPDDHPDLQWARGNLALTIKALGDFAGARSLEEKVLEVRTRTLPDGHPDLQNARQSLALTIQQLGDLAGARALQEKVLEVGSSTLRDDHPGLQWARGNLAVTIKALGDLSGARSLEEKVLEVRTRTLPDDHADLQKARQNLALTLQQLGDLAGARTLQEHVLEVRSRTLPEDHPDLQAARVNLARTMYMLGDFAGARTLCELVHELYSRILPEDHPELARARGLFASTLYELRDFVRARALQEQVLELYARTLPPDHLSLTTARVNLGSTLHALGDLAGARKAFEQALEVLNRKLPGDHFDLQVARANLALTIRDLGDLAGARALQEQVLEVFSRTLPREHRQLQQAWLNLAVTFKLLGDLARARELEEQVLDVYARTLPSDHPDLLAARQSLGSTLYSLGNLARARELFEQVLEVHARSLPEDHPALQRARLNFAAVLVSAGDRTRARAIYEQVLEVYSRTLHGDHPDLRVARQGLAATISLLGDLLGAQALQEQVLKDCSRALPDNHPDLTGARLCLAGTRCSLGDLAGARAMYESLLEIGSRTLPDSHPDMLHAREGLALTIKGLGDLAGARALEEQVLEIRSRTLSGDHPDLTRVRLNLASTRYLLDDLSGARAMLEQVLELALRTLHDDHHVLLSARAGLAVAIATESARLPAEAVGGRAANKKRCADLILALVRARARLVREILVSCPAREAEARCAHVAEDLGTAISFARGWGVFERSRELDAPAFELSENARSAAILAASFGRKAAGSPKYPELRDALVLASEELAGLARTGTTAEAFEAARRKHEDAERALIALAGEMSGTGCETVGLDVPTISQWLGERAVSVCFRQFGEQRIETSPEGEAGDGPPVLGAPTERLCAFVVRGGSSGGAEEDPAERLTLVDLGPLAPIQQAVSAWREAIGHGEGRGLRVEPTSTAPPTSLAAGEELRRLVLDPLLDALGEPERVVLVLDDVLHLVPFDALPLDSAGARLVGDRWKIETRATLGELWSGEPVAEGQKCLLAIGGVLYDGAEVVIPPSTERVEVASVLRGGAWAAGFTELPATGEEVEGIAATFREAFRAAASTELLEHGDAKRERMIELAPQAHFLHVATHGWFAPESIRSWSDPDPLDARSGLGLRTTGEDQVTGMSPMLLCGLALAGANLPDDELGRVPGLVTAEELAALDLTRCELAVLSACDTARGDLRHNGQGVASLQRALQMAGARSVITSLWKVPDEATKELMLDFYRRIWVEKQPKGQALWKAKMRIKDETGANGNPKYTTRDWAAWVLTGEPD